MAIGGAAQFRAVVFNMLQHIEVKDGVEALVAQIFQSARHGFESGIGTRGAQPLQKIAVRFQAGPAMEVQGSEDREVGANARTDF